MKIVIPHLDEFEQNSKIKNEEHKSKIKLNSLDLKHLVTSFKEFDV